MKLDDLAEVLAKERDNRRTIVLCHGVFDLLHLGHMKYFQEAKSFGDILVVTVTPDEYVMRGPGRPVFTAEQRKEAIESLEVVDYAAVNNWATATETIKLLEPRYYVKGPDYKNHKNDVTGNIKLEKDAIEGLGGEIRYTSNITFSSSQLINQNVQVFSNSQKEYIDGIKEKYDLDAILSYFNKMKSKKVLVVGETIIDEYVACNALGKAGKDPIMILQKLDSSIYPGGILAVGNHLSDFSDDIHLFSYLGFDRKYEDYINENLSEGIRFDAISKQSSPTIVKRRYLDSEKKSKLIGVYDINDKDITEDEAQSFIDIISKHIEEVDVVIVTDYGHGLITKKVVDFLSEKSKYLCVNTQLNSANIGFHTISKYHKADYICMHEGELRHDFRSKSRSVKDLAMDLHTRLNSNLVTVTQGAAGSMCFEDGQGFVQCPAFANKIVDKVGAGDTLFALTSLCFAVGMPPDLALLLGNVAAAGTVASVGNSESLDKGGLFKAMETMFK